MVRYFYRFIPAFLLLACVTVNIYFPAADVKNAADKIVHEVWGSPIESKEEHIAVKPPQKSSLLLLFNPSEAVAEQDIDVSTPEIRAIKASIKARSGELKSFLDSGAVGIALSGLLAVKDQSVLSLKDRSKVKRLVGQENKDRENLYSAIAKANGFPNKVEEVKQIFAKSWREQASAGWYLESKSGWKRK